MNRISKYLAPKKEYWRVPMPDEFPDAARRAIEYCEAYHCIVILETGIGEFSVYRGSSWKSVMLAWRIRWDEACYGVSE